MVILGYVLIVFGVLMICLGFFAATLEVFVSRKTRVMGLVQVDMGGVFKVLPELVKALTAAPKWLAIMIMGIILVGFGLQLVI